MSSGIDQYRELRDRNNEASRKSRLSRKAGENEMREVAAKLDGENESLKIRLDEMERLVKNLTDTLLKALMKTKTRELDTPNIIDYTIGRGYVMYKM
jgi:hypothetical protein